MGEKWRKSGWAKQILPGKFIKLGPLYQPIPLSG
jgi:hypothetical protein